ncbi:MAG: histidine phosphatase family protein [Alphaproteobacteria bacterium]
MSKGKLLMHSIYLVRHGKAELGGDEAERPLTPEGFVHAKQVSQILFSLTPRIAALYSSPFRRAKSTLEPLAGMSGLPVNIVDALREKHMSDEPIPDLAAARRQMWADFTYRLPGGETNAEAQERATKALKKLEKAHPMEAVAVASHGTLIGLILNSYDPGFGYDEWREMTMPDIYRIDVKPSGKGRIEHVGCAEIETFRVRG